MTFSDINIRFSYTTTPENEIINDFFLPVLSQAKTYKRAVGYFSSSMLIYIEKGMDIFIKNGGSIEIITSPMLSDADIDAITKGYKDRSKVFEEVIARSFEIPKNESEVKVYNRLYNLIKDGKLDIRLAVMKKVTKSGIFHEKIGIFEDSFGYMIAFTGSLNETENAVKNSFESIDVFTSWGKNQDLERVEEKYMHFKNLWENKNDMVEILNISPKIFDELSKYTNAGEKYRQLNFPFPTNETEKIDIEHTIDVGIQIQEPLFPEHLEMREYQKDAIDAWRENDFVGLFNMATGTGKTLTALFGVLKLWEKLQAEKKKLLIIIVCPYKHLVEQWSEDVHKFNLRYSKCYGEAALHWQSQLDIYILALKSGVIDNFCIISTFSTFKSLKIQAIIDDSDFEKLLIVDEAHGAGASEFRKYLLDVYKYRLALSATPSRKYDDEGNKYIINFFKKEVFYFGLDKAIKENFLTPYYYYPQIVYLTEDELQEYYKISKKINRLIASNSGDLKKCEESDGYKKLLIERARLVAGAKNKVDALKKSISAKPNVDHTLIYCGATYAEDGEDEEIKTQITQITEMLGHDLDLNVSRFTAQETVSQRLGIIKEFESGFLNAIVAIKCLDEGINIPSIKSAYILASSSNPREFVQRRGRVLRKAKGKEYAEIYDFITLPREMEWLNSNDMEWVKLEYSLIRKELERAEEFAKLAINFASSISEIRKIDMNYRLFIGGYDNDK